MLLLVWENYARLGSSEPPPLKLPVGFHKLFELGRVQRLSWRIYRVKIRLQILNLYGDAFAEKLVPKLEYAYILYSKYSKIDRPKLGHQHNAIPAELEEKLKDHSVEIQVSKHFSGDVSGNIGEAIFAYIVHNRYGVQNIVHLRPAGAKAPDFLIFDDSEIKKLKRLVSPDHEIPTNTNYLLVECKSRAGGPLEPERIKAALGQLTRVMDTDAAGLLFILHKPRPHDDNYKAYMIGLLPCQKIHRGGQSP